MRSNRLCVLSDGSFICVTLGLVNLYYFAVALAKLGRFQDVVRISPISFRSVTFGLAMLCGVEGVVWIQPRSFECITMAPEILWIRTRSFRCVALTLEELRRVEGVVRIIPTSFRFLAFGLAVLRRVEGTAWI